MSDVSNYFKNRRLVIATMHGKEQVIAPLLREALGVETVVASGLNTDQFGTFSGEIERMVDPLEAARRKCRLASDRSDSPLALASEGSFGPHPSMFFIPADEEFLLLTDNERQVEFKCRLVSTRTNFAGTAVHSWEEARRFAETALFPSHALILRKKERQTDYLVKGINSWEHLQKEVVKCLALYGQAFLETDMRAMHNPTRMQVIKDTTEKLIETLRQSCPQCGTPGFAICAHEPGLPCDLCGQPTRSSLTYIYGCPKCAWREEKKFPHGKQTEDPMYCDYCNP